MIKDYYSILGVEKTASRNEIIAAFRNLAKKYHPDRNNDPQTTARFKEIYEAYEILKDPSKRDEYDKIFEKYYGEKEPYDHNYYENINSWANKAQSNFDKYVDLNIKDFLKVTLEKVTYQSLKSLRFGINAVLFVITLLFTFLTLLVIIGFWGHMQNGTLSAQVVFNFVLISSIQVGLIMITRKFILKYQNQYGA